MKGTIMDHLIDEFSKSLAESLPRRESLRRLGAVFAGAVLGPLGLETAWRASRTPARPSANVTRRRSRPNASRSVRRATTTPVASAGRAETTSAAPRVRPVAAVIAPACRMTSRTVAVVAGGAGGPPPHKASRRGFAVLLLHFLTGQVDS